MSLSLIAAAGLSLVVPTPPTVQQYVVVAPAVMAVDAPSPLFPTTSALAGAVTSLGDELEKAAQIQKAQDAKIDAQVRAEGERRSLGRY